MPNWTPDQQKAIDKSGTNIIVSAGAGSGKTAVLSERVIEKLTHGTHINELLILTFTNAAAAEMKDRIRKKIQSNESLKHELEKAGCRSKIYEIGDGKKVGNVKKFPNKFFILDINFNICNNMYVRSR